MLKGLLISSVILIGLFSESYAQTEQEIQAFIENAIEKDRKNPDKATAIVISKTAWDGTVIDSDYKSSHKVGRYMKTFTLECISGGGFDASFTPISGGTLSVYVVQDGKILASADTPEPGGTASVSGTCVSSFWGGGCLIATATFGSELSPKIQQLREVRDDVLQTESGSIFMAGFNQIYYLFSPTIADWERQNPIFKDLVRIAITPLISILSILQYVEIDSEEEVILYGISIILLNVSIYFGVPALLILKFRKILKLKQNEIYKVSLKNLRC